MNLARADAIAKAVLFEGYMLYPYRPSSVKNRQRFNFGVVYPQAYCDAQEGAEKSFMQTECLIQGDAGAILHVRLQCLHLQTRSQETSSPPVQDFAGNRWQEAVERRLDLFPFGLEDLCSEPLKHFFEFPGDIRKDEEERSETIEGAVEAGAEKVSECLYRIRVRVRNTAVLHTAAPSRGEALLRSLVSAHFILGVNGGAFVSLLEPPPELQELAAQCQNAGVWPVLVGEPGQQDTLLASPIILYDYPQIAAESAGDLFDGTEIDEILSLRIMTLTEEEKNEIRQSDERARQILERTDAMPVEQFMKLHGAVRGLRPLKENS